MTGKVVKKFYKYVHFNYFIYLSPFSQSLSNLKLLRFECYVLSLRRAMGSNDTRYCLHPFILFSLAHFDPLNQHMQRSFR